MVRGYDPVSTDLSTLLWNHLFSFFTNSTPLSLQDAHTYVQHWLTSSLQTSTLYRSFSKASVKPAIRLRKHCKWSSMQGQGEGFSQDGKYFPSTTLNNEVVICIDQVENKLQLKESLDRELTYLSLRTTRSNPTSNPEEQQRGLMEDIYESCYAGYKNYRLSESVTKEMAMTCCKYLFFRKSKSNLPVDRKFRYVSKLTDELSL